MEGFAKITFMFVNLIVTIFGVVCMLIGLYGHYLYNYLTGISTTISFIPYITIGMGCFITSLGVVGCCAVLRKNTWLLKLYMLYLSALIFVEVIGGVVLYVNKDEVSKDLYNGLTIAVVNYNETNNKLAMDLIQRNLKCCGVKSFKDYLHSTNKTHTFEMSNHTLNSETGKSAPEPTSGNPIRWFSETDSVPVSCCIHSGGRNCSYMNVSATNANETGIFTRGCYTVVKDGIHKDGGIIIGAWVGVLLIHVLGIVSALVMKLKIQNIHRYQRITTIECDVN